MDYGLCLNASQVFPCIFRPKKSTPSFLLIATWTTQVPFQFSTSKAKTAIHEQTELRITQLLIQDFIHLSGYYLPFEYLELKSMMKSNKHLDYGVEEKVGDMKFKLLNAGHTPGSASVLVEARANAFSSQATST